MSEVATLSHSQFSPLSSGLNPPSAQHNQRVLDSIATVSFALCLDSSNPPQLTSCFSGFVAGILGLTNLSGFALYLLASLLNGAVVSLVKCQGKVGKYVPAAHAGAGPQGVVRVSTWRGWLGVTGLSVENLLGFLLFWIGGYALVHGEFESELKWEGEGLKRSSAVQFQFVVRTTAYLSGRSVGWGALYQQQLGWRSPQCPPPLPPLPPAPGLSWSETQLADTRSV